MTRNSNKNRVFRFNRRIRGLTDYSLRLKLLKSNMTRAVIRRSNKNMLIQFVDYTENGDKIIVSAKSTDLKKLGFNINTGNISAAYLTGLLAGKRLLTKKFNGECIIDLGLQNASFYGSRLYATVMGIKDSGVKVRVSDVVFPSEDRINGSHLTSKDAQKVIEKTKKAIEAMK
ncbi:MAG: 50S ribosomal protein L18 [Nanoarchaeota archaeon]|nr:50S ribosomal protein L18 [Nanoarchaeota archaeon]